MVSHILYWFYILSQVCPDGSLLVHGDSGLFWHNFQCVFTILMLLQGAASAVQLVQLYGFWYSHSRATGMFERVPRMPADFCQQLERALHALSAVNEGMQGERPQQHFTVELCAVWSKCSIAHIYAASQVIRKRQSTMQMVFVHAFRYTQHLPQACMLLFTLQWFLIRACACLLHHGTCLFRFTPGFD